MLYKNVNVISKTLYEYECFNTLNGGVNFYTPNFNTQMPQ